MESSLNETYDQLRERIAYERGYPRDLTKLSADQADIVERVLKDGCAKVYVQARFQWSFLKPLATLVLEDGKSSLALPGDFGNLLGKLYFTDGDIWGKALEVKDDSAVLEQRMLTTSSTGRPELAAIVPTSAPGSTHGQGQELIFWPEADADYTVQCRYTVVPDAIGAGNKYHYGGAAHSRTFVEACLAASEEFDSNPGYHCVRGYPEALEASKEYDRKVKPQTIGFDGSWCGRKYKLTSNIVTYTPSW